MTSQFVLEDGVLPMKSPEGSLDAPFWEGTRAEKLLIQRCRSCREFQWGPEVVCHHCHSFEVGFEEVAPRGSIYSWERVWHPPHPLLASSVPFVIAIIALDDAPAVRLIGNLLVDAEEDFAIGDQVTAAFEHHEDYTLVQWRTLHI